MSDYLNPLSKFLHAENQSKVPHIVIGHVTANVDSKNHTHRVKVAIPVLEGGGVGDKAKWSSHWVRIASFMAGAHVGDNFKSPRGAHFLPEIGDEVLVAFEHGDSSRGVIIGRMWSDVAPDKQPIGGDDGDPNPPIQANSKDGVLAGPLNPKTPRKKTDTKTKHEAGKNDLSGIVTRMGHTLLFNDNQDEPAIYLQSAQGHRIELLDGGKKGILIADANENYVWLKSGSANGDIEISTTGSVKIHADKDIVLDAGQKLTTTSGAATNMKSKGFTLDSDGEMKLTSTATGTIKGSALNLVGDTINLN